MKFSRKGNWYCLKNRNVSFYRKHSIHQHGYAYTNMKSYIRNFIYTKRMGNIRGDF
jgi:hypothetical protein